MAVSITILRQQRAAPDESYRPKAVARKRIRSTVAAAVFCSDGDRSRSARKVEVQDLRTKIGKLRKTISTAPHAGERRPGLDRYRPNGCWGG